MRTVGLLYLFVWGAWLGWWSLPAAAQAPQPPSDQDPALARILLWQLDRGETAKAEKYMKEYLAMLGTDPNRYQTLRQSPCFAIYMARPAPEKLSSR